MSDNQKLQEMGLPCIGEVISGKYRVDGVVGQGGMGIVVAATHVHLGEKAAIKFLSGDAAKDAGRVQRFTREAWAAAKIKSHHVARVTDVAALPDGTPYLVMEHLEGEDLERKMRRGRLQHVEAIDFLLQAMEALAEAHRLGIVHRDLKPGNLFVTSRADGSPWIKVLDFGISKFTGGESLTATKSLMGSPLYMAPEQLASSKHVDARADIWSLGVILYELLTGVSPFKADTLPQVCTKVLHMQPPALNVLAPDIPPNMQAAAMRFLEKDPNARYQNLGAAAQAIAPFGSAEGQTSLRFILKVVGGPRPSTPSHTDLLVQPASETLAQTEVSQPETSRPQLTDPQVPMLGAATASPVTTSRSTPRRSAVGGALAVVVGLIAVGVIAIVVLAGGDDDSIPTTAAPREATTSDSKPAAPSEPVAIASANPQPAATASASASSSATPKAAAKPLPKVYRPPPTPKPPTTPFDPFKGR